MGELRRGFPSPPSSPIPPFPPSPRARTVPPCQARSGLREEKLSIDFSGGWWGHVVSWSAGPGWVTLFSSLLYYGTIGFSPSFSSIHYLNERLNVNVPTLSKRGSRSGYPFWGPGVGYATPPERKRYIQYRVCGRGWRVVTNPLHTN